MSYHHQNNSKIMFIVNDIILILMLLIIVIFLSTGSIGHKRRTIENCRKFSNEARKGPVPGEHEHGRARWEEGPDLAISGRVDQGQRCHYRRETDVDQVDMLSKRELPAPPALSKWIYSMVKLSYVRVEPSSTALSHVHPHPSSNTTSCVVRTRYVPGSRMR
jgi:hypothetical protein